MPRPFCRRLVAGRPPVAIFKPAGRPLSELDEVVLTLDEFEASRLADLEGLYQEQAAEKMGVSRPTFSRILETAHRKIADALVHGKALRIEGGPVHMGPRRCCRLHDAGAGSAEESAVLGGPEPDGKSGETKEGVIMNICIPVNEDRGLDSPVCAHFGSAPLFLLVDVASGSYRTIPNHNQHHGHGMCAPLAALQGQSIDSVAVGGIGMGALAKLQAAGFRVFQAEHATVAETVAAFKAGTLRTMTPANACAHHARGSN